MEARTAWDILEASRRKTLVAAEQQTDITDDELDEDISFEMKMAMIFITIYYSTPKQ